MEKQLFIGTSGWSYDDWQGRFYPEHIKPAARLDYYLEHFNTVEINTTFYRLPTIKMIEHWNAKFPARFHLVVKGSRFITHMKKIKNCEAQLETFLDLVLQLKTLKIVLWQLPPMLKMDLERLEQFIKLLPTGVRYAFEFRHNSWWKQDVVDLLNSHKSVFVAISHPELPATIYQTANFLYLRFHGQGSQLYQADYSDTELNNWAKQIQAVLGKRKLYAFFNNDYHAHAVYNALSFEKYFKT